MTTIEAPDVDVGVGAAFAAVCAVELDAMDRDAVAVVLGEVRRLRSCLDAVEVRAARRLRQLAAEGRSEPVESVLGNAGGRTGREARDVTGRDELCDETPALDDALGAGSISGSHLDAIASAAKGLPPEVREEFLGLADRLLARAASVSLDAFARECRQLAKHLLAMSRRNDDVDELAAQRAASKLERWVDQQTGMHHTHLQLDAERDAKLHSAMLAELGRLRRLETAPRRDWEQLKVEAFLHAVCGIATPVGGPADGADPERRPDGTDAADQADGSDEADGAGDGGERAGQCGRSIDRVPEITALIDYRWLIGQVAHGVCETDHGVALPISTVRRLACEAEIVPTVLGGRGEVLDQGRGRRTATRGQRRALRAMHRTCAYPDCRVGFDVCRIHHVRWWWRHLGPTDIDNLVPLCERHHHMVHEGGWHLALAEGRVATWTRPDGTLWQSGCCIDRRAGPTDECS